MWQLRAARISRRLLLVLLLVAALLAAYIYLTRPARLRALALQALRDLPLAGVDVDEVTCSPTGDLRLTGLVAGAAGFGVAARDGSADDHPLSLRIGAARISCDLPDLLVGRVRPLEIELRDVDVAVVCNTPEAADQSLAERAGAEARLARDWLRGGHGGLPRIVVDGGDLQVFTTLRGKPQLLERWLWRAEGHTTSDGYEVRVDHRPAGARPLATLVWRPATGQLDGALDSVDLKSIAHVAPRHWAEVLHRYELSGRVCASRVELQLSAATENAGESLAGVHVAALEVSLVDGRCVLPLAGELVAASGAPNSGPFLRLSEVSVALDYRAARGEIAGTAALTLSGQLRGAALSLRAQLASDVVRQLWGRGRETLSGQGDVPHAALDEIEDAELNITALDLPHPDQFAAFLHSPDLPGPIATAFKDYEPRGRMDVHLKLNPLGAAAPDGAPRSGVQRLEGEFRPLGAACEYFRFPYAFENASGLVRLLDGQILLEDLQARHGGAEIRAAGRLNDTLSWTGFDLEFRGRNLALDKDLYAALPPEYRELWDTAAPLGKCDVVTTLRRPEGTAEAGAQPTEVAVDAQLLTGSVALGDGRRLQPAAGEFRIHDGIVEVRDLRGQDGDATVRLDGVVGAGQHAAETDLHVDVTGWPLRHELVLADDAGGEPLRARFSGRADMSGRVYGGGNGTPRTQDLDVHITAGELVGADSQRPWTITTGQARVRGTERKLESLLGHQGAATLELSGRLPDGATPQSPIALRLRATTPRAEELYPQFLPRTWVQRIADFGLSGPADVTVVLHPNATDPQTARQAAEVSLNVAQVRPRALPLDLRDLQAELSAAPGSFRIATATAQYGAAGQIQLRQNRAGTYDGGGGLDAEFEISATKLAFTPELLAALPAGLGRVLDRAGVSGEFDAAFPRVRIGADEPGAWQFEGELTLRDFALRSGFELTAAAGSLQGNCRATPAGAVTLESTFALQQGQIANRPISDWRGELLYDPSARWLRLESVEGRICDGVVQGALWIDPESSDYELTAWLNDLAVAQLLPPAKTLASAARPGRLAGQIWLRGRAGDPSSRRGGGTVRVSGASFIQTPVLAAVVLQRKYGVSDTVDLADVRFRWEGREILLERIDIRSRDLRLVGEGRWTPADDRLRMTLWAADPDLWPRLGMLSDWLQSAGQDLVQYHVEGTLASPKVTAEPLRRLNAALKQLLGEE